MEHWKPVAGYEGLYDVSDLGRVRNARSGRLKKPTPNKKDNRLYLLLWKDNRYRLFKVHRLVLTAFRGPCPEGCESCHNDGDASNNALKNLRWDTASANQMDRVKHGTSNRGERCGTSKLTEKQARAIKNDPRTQAEISKAYHIGQAQVSRIKSGKRWPHI